MAAVRAAANGKLPEPRLTATTAKVIDAAFQGVCQDLAHIFIAAARSEVLLSASHRELHASRVRSPEYQRRVRRTSFAIQTIAKIAITHGARNAIATPIIRRLHIIAPALCANVRRSVASGPLS